MVEINGSTHNYDLTKQVLPNYQLKHRLFEAAGINVLDINYQDYISESGEVKMDDIIKAIKKKLETSEAKIEARGVFQELLKTK